MRLLLLSFVMVFALMLDAQGATGDTFKINSKILAGVSVSVCLFIYHWVLGGKDKESGRRSRLMYLVWAVIGVNVIETLFCHDMGFGSGASGVVLTGLSIWLAVAIGNNKNWARVTWIVSSFLFGFFSVVFLIANSKDLLHADSSLGVVYLALLSLYVGGAIVVACVLLNKDVKTQFVKDSKGVVYAWTYWIVLVICLGWSIAREEDMEKTLSQQEAEQERYVRQQEKAYQIMMENAAREAAREAVRQQQYQQQQYRQNPYNTYGTW